MHSSGDGGGGRIVSAETMVWGSPVADSVVLDSPAGVGVEVVSSGALSPSMGAGDSAAAAAAAAAMASRRRNASSWREDMGEQVMCEY